MRKVLLLAIAVFCVLGAWSQQRVCGTMEHYQMLLQADPRMAFRQQAVDQYAQNFVYNAAAGQRAVITIPVVVHVVYRDSAGSISMAQIQSQIDRLNLDFHKLNADTANVPAAWRSLIADCNIQFCLAQRTPTGTATNGVVRKRTTVTSWSTNDNVKYTSQGGDDAWPASSYLNLWVCDLGQSLLGYAQFPGGPAATDGVVILNKAFGSNGTAAAPYNKGRTATHEIGHWLSLYHIWGDDNGACSGTDQVNDTPNQADMNYGCPTYPRIDACATSSPGAMFMNYMDYVDDGCMDMFTNGQNTRIQSLFGTSGSRRALLTSQGCVPVSGGPATAFTANKTTICLGQSINFTDQSTGSPTSWSWSFPGATPTTSTTQNPQNIVYNTAGTYSVTLTATNAGGSTPLTKTSYITVLGTTPLPLREGFEATTFPPAGWSLGNADASTTWVRTTNASGFGTSTASAYMNNYDYNAVGQRDYLYTPVYNFGNGLNAASKLKFDYAYSYYNAQYADTLQVLVSTDCGTTWTSLWKKGGPQLTTTSTVYQSKFVPTATEWKRDSTISLAPYVGMPSVQFAFLNITKFGQSMLLDNINIDTVVVAAGCTSRPTAAFVASPATVTQGSSVTYTDQSTGSPTAWAWTFPGGSTASSTSQAPGAITYSTPGTYTTRLRVTNACGSDSTTVTITVIAGTSIAGCDTMDHLLPNDSARLYSDGNSTWGFLSGRNSYHDLAKAEKYTNATGRPVSSVLLGFIIGRSAGPTDSVSVSIWDANGPSGLPGTVLGTTKVAMSTVVTNVNTGRFTVANFPCPIPTNSTFYVGFNINYIAGDTIAVATTSYFNRANHAYQGYELSYINATTSSWNAVDSSWFPLSHYIFPVLCTQTAPAATFTANKTSLCPGDSVSFTDQSTNCASSWSWQVNGPVNMVSSVKNPTFTFTTAGTYTVIHSASNAGGTGTVTQTAYITVRPLPGEAMTSTAVSCFGGTDGTATVAASGGTSYTYLWAPGGGTGATISGKPAGTYTVTVTSNFSCSSTASISIAQPFSALAAATSFSSAYCGNTNGSVTVTATGGNGGFTYLWSPGGATTASVSNLSAGTYSVTVRDSKNCSVVSTATVTSQTAAVNISFSNTNSTCGASNGTIVASINGSSNGAHYIWSRGDTTGSITNVAPGIYTVTITNSLGCSASKSDTMVSTGGPVVTTSATAVACRGGSTGSATATATGTGTLTYLWSPGGATTATITGRPAGTYTVVVSDAGSCQTTATATISQPATAVTASATATNVACFGAATGTATVTASGGTGTLTYAWSPGGGTTATITRGAGTYTVTVRDASQCSAVATATITQPATAVTVTTATTAVSCYGGTDGTATATGTGGTGTLTYSWNPGGGSTASITRAAGTYTVTVRDASQCSATGTATISQPTAAVSATATATPVICTTAGTATVTGAGGNAGGYTYLWSPGAGTTATISGLTAATYSVTVRDSKQCSAVTSVVVQNQSVTLAVTITKTDATCGNSNGSVQANTTATGVTYTWSPGGSHATSLTGIPAGTYSVVISNSNGCSASATTNVQNANGAQVTSSSTAVSCFGASDGAASVTATGGSGSYTYLWSPGGAVTSGITGKTAGTYSVTVSDGTSCNATASVVIGGPSAAVSATAAATPVICTTAGTATVTGAGGNTGGYTYLWSPGSATTATISGLTAATYSVTVRDSRQCSAVTSVTVQDQSPTLSVSISKTDASCGSNNGAATASTTASGVTYRWSPGGSTASSISGLSVGTYNVTITNANGCTASATTTISNTSGATLSTAHTDAHCHGGNDGTATVTATGGTGTPTYLWSGNGGVAATATGLIAGTYTVTVTSGGCTSTATAVVGEPAPVTIVTTSSPVICSTLGTATATGQGGTGSGYTYLWSTTATSQTVTGLTAASYAVTVRDGNQCSAVANANISTQVSDLRDSTTVTPASASSTADGTATAHPVGGTANFTYLWSNTQHTQTATQLLPGTYTFTITDANGCTTVDTVVITSGPTAVADIQTSVRYTVSPNPASDKCTITIEMNETLPVELTIYSMIGQKVYSRDLGHIRSAAEVVETADLAAGVYVVKIKAGTRTYSTRLIRE